MNRFGKGKWVVMVEQLRENDLESLAALYEQFWNERSSVEKMKTTFGRLRENPDYLFLVAKEDNRVIGSVMGVVCHELYGECKPFLVVEDMIVDKHSRRKGAGTQLLRGVERFAIDRECCSILLITERDRTGAHAFYESMGYDGSVYKGFKKRLCKIDHP